MAQTLLRLAIVLTAPVWVPIAVARLIWQMADYTPPNK